ncbi:hypothetical protein G3N59_06225 [Paraburkholderia sp. Ac-20340]|uniref:hypothetical protein n=1 Tax=Paraburkholderia sp. Ac-20340 TaxID=2703888 RepID=UPI00197F8726|nr:hypothetical protein [Paraburkholderia sp. Ac-20340]MBN3852972.1 hypothetical protein [Paraburkholderia sp. Ac-20340]
MKRPLLTLVAGLAPLFAHAGCEEHFQIWMEKLHPGQSLDREHAACKIWPANEALTIAALPIKHASDNDDGGSIDVDVLVADTSTGTIAAHHFQAAAVQYESGHFFDGIEIDSARYQLTPTQRAIGVRLTSSGGYPADMSGVTTLSLYLFNDARMRTVLDRMKVGEWHASRGSACDSEETDTKRTITMGVASANDYAPLKIEERTIDQTVSGNAEKCWVSKSPAQRRSVTLPYQHGTYGIPADLQYSND